MSPRKEHNKVPSHIVGAIRSKTKSILHGPYPCPVCGKDSLRIIVNEESQSVRARCRCGVTEQLSYNPNNEAIDYYNDYIDNY